MHNFTSIVHSHDEMNNLMNEIAIGGARGLEVISIAECKNIQD